jgi:hypothetical protein
MAAWMIRLPEPGSMYARKGITSWGLLHARICRSRRIP